MPNDGPIILFDDETTTTGFTTFHGLVRDCDEHGRLAAIFRNRCFSVLRIERSASCWSITLVRPADVGFTADELRPMFRKFLQNRGFNLERSEPVVSVVSRCWRISFQSDAGQIGLGIKYTGYRKGVLTECREEYRLAEHECYPQHSRRRPGADERFRREPTTAPNGEDEEFTREFKQFQGLIDWPNLNCCFGRVLVRARLKPFTVECLETGKDWRIVILSQEPHFFSSSKKTAARLAKILTSGSEDTVVTNLTLKRTNYRLTARFSGPLGVPGLSLRGGVEWPH